MRIVIDTNVLISGVFFGGFPREILRAVVDQKIIACATTEIINEYEEIVQEMIDRKQRHINRTILGPLKLWKLSNLLLMSKYAVILTITNSWNAQKILMLYILSVEIKTSL